MVNVTCIALEVVTGIVLEGTYYGFGQCGLYGTGRCKWYGTGRNNWYGTLIEMLGEFFLIYDEGRRCKVIYDENIFPHI